MWERTGEIERERERAQEQGEGDREREKERESFSTLCQSFTKNVTAIFHKQSNVTIHAIYI